MITNTFKCGARVKVLGFGWNGEETFEYATITRRTKNAAGLPVGYHPVRFDADGGRLMVHESRLDPAPDAPTLPRGKRRLERKVRLQAEQIAALTQLMNS